MKNLIHKAHQRILVLSCIASLPCSVSAEGKNNFEVIQKSSGKSVITNLINIDKTHLTVRLASGKVVRLKRADLTKDSVKRAETLLNYGDKLPHAKVETLNSIIGHKLFGEKTLWKEEAAVIAQRLGWRAEEKKVNPSSYRSYPPKAYQFLGTHPYCATIYANEVNIPQRISLVFANKGDYGSTAGFGEDHFKKMHPTEKMPKSLEEAIALDKKLVQASLTKAFDKEPIKQSYGEKGDRRTVLRWDFEDQSFLLSSVKGEYVNLLIVPSRSADLKGKVKLVKDADLKKQLAENLRYTMNSDVYIENIPMVNQGPKGYCAPATFERAMTYMKIPADMYLLATAATKANGGTNTNKLIDDCKRIIRSKARRVKEVEIGDNLKIETIAKYVDRGVPILWRMRSLSGYNSIANKRTAERAKITDLKAWSADIQKEADEKKSDLKEESDNHHICMIIGYNKTTKEIGVSDSWGPRFELRWIHIDILTAVSSKGSFAIDF